jgi:hypothetical protein
MTAKPTLPLHNFSSPHFLTLILPNETVFDSQFSDAKLLPVRKYALENEIYVNSSFFMCIFTICLQNLMKTNIFKVGRKWRWEILALKLRGDM